MCRVYTFLATYLLICSFWLTSKVFAQDPWHIFSSSISLESSFMNVLNVSWGTKGGDKAEALPSILSSETKDADSSVVEDMHCIQEDVDAAFKETITCTVTKIDGKEVIEKLVVDDQNETFCTCLVTFWMFINVKLATWCPSVHKLVHSVVEDSELSCIYSKVGHVHLLVTILIGTLFLVK
ncbi:class III chitin synthase [Suillus cothurnatus]|nr:class III chitin synthase [Suillus cothurnatus]